MSAAVSWLESRGDERRAVAEEAAAILLREYRHRFPSLLPIDVRKLATSLGVRIHTVPRLPGDARLFPVPGGFTVVISGELSSARYRTAIAHELAHTLFYRTSAKVPTRLASHTAAEEHFCFDVARRLLAPRWHIKALGLERLKDPAEVFVRLIRLLKLSRPVAARVMLDDYRLASGIAGRWSRLPSGWSPEPGRQYSSPDIKAEVRRRLRKVARDYLEGELANKAPGASISVLFEANRDAAFVVVPLSRELVARSEPQWT